MVFVHFQDAVESTSNTALRDFSAKCMREFLKWSIKQSSKDVMTCFTRSEQSNL